MSYLVLLCFFVFSFSFVFFMLAPATDNNTTMSQKVRKPKYQKRAMKKITKLYGNKDMDQIKVTEPVYNEDLPGRGMFACIECDRHFVDEKTQNEHKKTKKHKRRVKELKQAPYSIKESEKCGGLH